MICKCPSCGANLEVSLTEVNVQRYPAKVLGVNKGPFIIDGSNYRLCFKYTPTGMESSLIAMLFLDGEYTAKELVNVINEKLNKRGFSSFCFVENDSIGFQSIEVGVGVIFTFILTSNSILPTLGIEKATYCGS